jgi:hypothetical protein
MITFADLADESALGYSYFPEPPGQPYSSGNGYG